MNIELGKCKTCRHHWCDHFDPSEAGVSLSPGVICDCGCLKENELFKKYPDCETKQYGEDTECPLWELYIFRYCNTHSKWIADECAECLYEEEQKCKENENAMVIKGNFDILENGTYKCKFCDYACKTIDEARIHWDEENR